VDRHTDVPPFSGGGEHSQASEPQIMSESKTVILDLSPRIVSANLELDEASKAAVGGAGAAFAASDARGTVHNGVNTISASVGMESNTVDSSNEITISLQFDAYVSSVPIQSFNDLRSILAGLVGSDKVLRIDRDAGIPAGAQDGSGMERFAVSLFSGMFGGDFMVPERDFSATDCAGSDWKCVDVLQAIRGLKPQVLHFSGKLHVQGPPDVPQRMVASIPVTTVNFGSGYTVPFTGYAGPIVVEDAAPAGDLALVGKAYRIVLAAGKLRSCLIEL
jgi:hypothetical protein